ncbi:MAG: hypothetical protein LAN18_10555 [Acidobacteriia bacterium]|nr:hypothetical protein [Terriglobia bacterium]
MTNHQFFWYMVVQVLVAVGTVGAVVATLVQAFRGKLWPPKLSLFLRSEVGEKTRYSNPAPGHAPDVRYYHLCVTNERSWSPARDLSVHLMRIDQPGPDDKFQIKWSGDVPICCRDQQIYPLKQTIGSPIEYDICCVGKNPCVLRILPIIAPNNLTTQWTGPVKINLLLQVKCSENSSARASVQISWDGTWDDGDAEMKKHFKIKVSETTQT